MSMLHPVGIDLGTTNSVVSYASEMSGHFDTETVLIDGGERSMPSVVYFGPDETYVGKQALNVLGKNPEYVARSTKRYLGRGSSHRFPSATRQYSPVGVASEIIGILARDTSEYLLEDITEAVITVPADFSDAQRRLTREAADMAGVTVASLLAEPTAAALAYDLQDEDETTILVFDLGGGTFDASIIDIDSSIYEVNATIGNNELGGDDWTDEIVSHLIDSIERDHSVSVPSEHNDPLVHGRLLLAAEEMKKTLSSSSSATSQNLKYLEVGEQTIQSVDVTLSREEFEWRTERLREQLVGRLDDLFDGCSFKKTEIDEVLLVGGSTRMPQIPRLIEEYFGIQAQRAKNPDEVVASGAAIQAAMIGNRLALEGEVEGDGPTTIKTGDTEMSLAETVLIDAATRSLGFKTHIPSNNRSEYIELIENNARIPAEAEEKNVFPLEADSGCVGSSEVEFEVYETAESDPTPDFREKTKMGKVVISDLDTSVPIDEQRITISFQINTDNLLHVRAVEHSTGNESHGTFKPNLGQTSAEMAAEREILPRAYTDD